MDLHTVVALILSGAIGVSLGLLGGGGSILALPVLVYVAGIEAKESVAMSLAIVGSTSLFGSLLHWRKGKLDLKVAATFGGAGIIGAYGGARLTHLVANSTLLLLFAALMLVVAVAMLLRKDRQVASESRTHQGNLALTLLVGLVIGVLTGFLGVGGGLSEAAVIDPQRDVEQYIAEAKAQGLKIKYVIETHLHADFVSGHRELAARTGAEIVFGEKAGATFPHRAVREGVEIKIGKVILRILETPGHTPEGISILLIDSETSPEPQKVLTGDTLFIGDVGRPDNVAADSHRRTAQPH